MNESILLLIRQVYASAEQYGRRQLRAWGLSPAQAFVLDSLLSREGTCCASELREMLGISKSTLSELLTALQAKGFLEMPLDPLDDRKKRLMPTPKARQQANALHAAIQTQLQGLLQGLLPQQVDCAKAVLCRMRENLTQAE